MASMTGPGNNAGGRLNRETVLRIGFAATIAWIIAWALLHFWPGPFTGWRLWVLVATFIATGVFWLAGNIRTRQ
jgi:hypothetical protein